MGGGASPFRRVVGYADGGDTSVGVPAVVLAEEGNHEFLRGPEGSEEQASYVKQQAKMGQSPGAAGVS